MNGRVVITGGGLAAARTCERLRARGHEGEIVVLAGESVPPYDRPPLSKGELRRDATTASSAECTLRTDYAALNVDLRLDCPATGLDPEHRAVRTDAGAVEYDALVIATGAVPRLMPGTGDQLTLRTAFEATTLRDRLQPGTRVVLIGAGWINAEIATAASDRGCAVTCVESSSAPLAAALGESLGARLSPWWQDVDLRCGVEVEEVGPEAVLLRSGERLSADVVVSGIGVAPATGWLSGSNLAIDRGVLVDEHLRTSAPDVYAVGDVAARWSPRSNARLRFEHWDEARAAPNAVAGTITGEPTAHDPVPYFWSDQFGHKLQYVGYHRAQDELVVRRSEPAGDDSWGAAWLAPEGALTAHLSVDRPRLAVTARRAIANNTTPDPTALRDLDEQL